MRYNKKYLKKGSGKNEYNSYNENENENHNYERFFNAKNGLNNGSSFDFNHVNGLNNGSSFDFNHENGLNNGSSFDFNHENNESSLYNKTSFNPENNRNGLNNGSSFDFNHVNNESSLYNKTSFNPENNINGLNIKKANPVVLVNNENSKKTNNLVFNKIKIQTEYILNKNVKIDLVKIFFMFKNNNNQDVKIKIDWGSEKRFRYYLDILIKELIPNKSLKQFKSEHTNIRTIDLLGKLWDIVLNDKNPIYIQSDFYLLILETKIKNFKNTNQNENLQKYFILLNNIIEFIKNKNFENIDNLVNEFYELDINQQIINHQEMLSFNSLDNIDLKEKNDFTYFIFEILYNLQLCIYFIKNPLKKIDYVLSFILNAYKLKLINYFKFKKLIIDEFDYFTKKNNLFEFILEIQNNNHNLKNIYNLKNKNDRTINLSSILNINTLKSNIKLKKNIKYYEKYNNLLSNLTKFLQLFDLEKIRNYILYLQINSNKNLSNIAEYKNINSIRQNIINSMLSNHTINENKKQKIIKFIKNIKNKKNLIKYLTPQSLSNLKSSLLESLN